MIIITVSFITLFVNWYNTRLLQLIRQSFLLNRINDLELGCLHPVACMMQVMGGGVIPSTQHYYLRLILLLNTTYTATCFGRTTIFKQKYIIS
jgi:hypothetical protein